MILKQHISVFIFALVCAGVLSISMAQAEPRQEHTRSVMLQKMFAAKTESRKSDNKGSTKGLYTTGKGTSHVETINGRDFVVYTPPGRTGKKRNLPLLIVLHGGFGSADQIHKYIGLDPYADQNNFIIAYLNGTKVAAGLPEKFRGWNAGGCCGQPQARNIDDIGFVTDVIKFMKRNYNIDSNRVYGTGHSNGAMMTQRIMCETDLYHDAVTLSGTLQMDIKSCPRARGEHVLNIHGVDDENLPVAGGYTVKGLNKKTNYKSQAYTKQVFDRSGATYDLLLLEGADHNPQTLNAALWKTEGVSLPQKIVSELGLDR